jgi:hypothetical protein
VITTASKPYVIPAPRLGLFNLIDDEGRSLQAEDEHAFGPFFVTTARSSREPPQCDVLVAYVRLRDDGTVLNSDQSLEEIVWTACAPIVLIAIPNSDQSYINATRWFRSSSDVHGGSINLVMTLDRRGDLFGRFFSQLFSRMKNGETMPMAWVSLAPQAPGTDHDAPATIFACGAGHITFRGKPSLFNRIFGRKS